MAANLDGLKAALIAASKSRIECDTLMDGEAEAYARAALEYLREHGGISMDAEITTIFFPEEL